MKSRVILLSTASYLAVASVAYAADLPLKAPPPPPVIYNWTGFYIGVHGGVAGFNAKQSTLTVNDTSLGLCDPIETRCRFSDTSGVFGGQAGYNWQIQNWVLGVEGDGSWVNAKSTLLPFGSPTETATSKLDWVASARGRLGWVVADGAGLIYVTGGAAWAGINSNWTINDGCDLCPISVQLKDTVTGAVGGGGVEAMLSRNWTIRAEALYYDFGRKSVTHNAGADPVIPAIYTTQFKNTLLVGRFGLNFKW
jgi:outer membrane immunogenic protein